MKKILLSISLILLAAITLGLLFNYINNNKPKIPVNPEQVYCTEDVKICPDGSYVNRIPPNCVFKACPQSSIVNTDIILAVLQAKTISDLTITLNKIVQDSRCPADVQCIWAGNVTANVTLSLGSKAETVDILSNQTPYIFNGYKISITDVSPGKTSKHQILPSEYAVTFHIQN